MGTLHLDLCLLPHVRQQNVLGWLGLFANDYNWFLRMHKTAQYDPFTPSNFIPVAIVLLSLLILFFSPRLCTEQIVIVM